LLFSHSPKAGALHGAMQNGTPFQFSETNRAMDHFGAQLRDAGYNYVGSEPMYSGITGEELRADIFIGLVYYQRLRHMVSDKSQVRATGPVNSLTRQPIKGRKVHGGIRFGEMERGQHNTATETRSTQSEHDREYHAASPMKWRTAALRTAQIPNDCECTLRCVF
jgi:DNA-directed RNA polymerase beta subunit